MVTEIGREIGKGTITTECRGVAFNWVFRVQDFLIAALSRTGSLALPGLTKRSRLSVWDVLGCLSRTGLLSRGGAVTVGALCRDGQACWEGVCGVSGCRGGSLSVGQHLSADVENNQKVLVGFVCDEDFTSV